jgi:PadR family transcriptional regulator PadR
MTEKGLEFYAELERTWKELADAVHTITNETVEHPTTETNNYNQ